MDGQTDYGEYGNLGIIESILDSLIQVASFDSNKVAVVFRDKSKADFFPS